MNIPRQIGRYEIEAKLGSGSHADVYRAVDSVLKRTVALKVLKPRLLADEEAFARFLQEAQAASELVHDHIAWVWDVGEAQGFYYLAMRYVDGPPLDQVLAERGRLPWGEAGQIVTQVAQALDFAHAKGLVHRDVKPQNILVSPKDGAVLTDFGLVKAMQASGVSTRTGAIIGTPQYIAPEVWQDKPAGPASDQYALACVLVEMLTGQPLFGASTPPAIMARHFEPPALPTTWPEGTPPGIETVLQRALALDPAERYPTVSEFATAPQKMAQEELVKRESVKREVEQARRTAEEKARQEAEEVARLAAMAQARREIEAQVRREAEERARLQAEESARKEAAERARREVEARAQKEAAERARQEAQERARKEKEELARKDAEQRARKQAQDRAQNDAETATLVAIQRKPREAGPTPTTAAQRWRWPLLAMLVGGSLLVCMLAVGVGLNWIRPKANQTPPLPSLDVAFPNIAGPATSPTWTDTPLAVVDLPLPGFTATFSPSPSATSPITPTPSSTWTPSQNPLTRAIVNTTSCNLRAGPYQTHSILATYPRGTVVIVLGREPTGTWLYVEAQDGKRGWMWMDYLEVNADLSGIKLVDNIPTPPPTKPPTPAPKPPKEKEPEPTPPSP